MNDYHQINTTNRISSTAPTTPCVGTKHFNLPCNNNNNLSMQQQQQISEEEQDIPSLHDLIHNSTTTLDKQTTTQGNDNDDDDNSNSNSNSNNNNNNAVSYHNPNITLHSFNNYLSSIHCQENLQFILELNKFLTSTNKSNTNETLTHWQQIYSKFLIAESDWEVNLPSRLSSNLHFAQYPNESTLHNCKSYIINELLQNLYHEYLKTVTKNKCGLYRRRSVAMGSLPMRKNSNPITEDNKDNKDNKDNNESTFSSNALSPDHVRPTIDTAIIEQQCPLTPPYSPPPQLQLQQTPQTPVVSQYLQIPASASSSQSQPHSSLTRHISFFGRNSKRRHSSNSTKTTVTTNAHKHHDHHSHHDNKSKSKSNNSISPTRKHSHSKIKNHKFSSVMIDGYDYYSIPVDMDNSSFISSTSSSSASSSSLPPTSRSRPPSVCSNLVSDVLSSSSSAASTKSLTADVSPKELHDTPASSRNNSSSSKSGPSNYYKSQITTPITMVTSPTTLSGAGGSIHKIVDNSMSYFNKMKKFKFKRNNHEDYDDEC
ncbi:Rgs2 protein [Candida orthopsilosis Co 90-125]|uniref:Rgs2 protein n=1 Tax=Candida orthopsilosis (strain 90-125) TaxID=1136231 RepID=H8X636_CANO9|nr:Rgs2 protein [Candida orthopsilosis Co 90-125]CCG23284.1 Rgs2 protein [Candida orthopsilosis Co 90-125]